jgi:hypothetical protein
MAEEERRNGVVLTDEPQALAPLAELVRAEVVPHPAAGQVQLVAGRKDEIQQFAVDVVGRAYRPR